MEKQIPVFFNTVVSSPLEEISSGSNIGRAKVHVFSRYRNRNYSYITDEVAEQLASSAAGRPVVGFWDKQTQDWASHMGPTVVHAYGYIEDFIGWEPVLDTDGVSREYATFSVVLFSDYFDEAKNIIGKSQSMELDKESIAGQWKTFDTDEYFVYTQAKMHSFCILGDAYEPCFSGSRFFTKEEGISIEKFSLLVSDLMEKVKEIETKSEKGGREEMVYTVEHENFEKVFMALNPEFSNEEPKAHAVIYSMNDEEVVVFDCVSQKNLTYKYTANENDSFDFELVNEFDAQAAIQELNDSISSKDAEIESFEAKIAEMDAAVEQYENTIKEKEEIIENYEKEVESNTAMVEEFSTKLNESEEKISEYIAENDMLKKILGGYELAEKNSLIDSYSAMLTEEEINGVRENVENFSYDEIESKLAVMFSRNNLKERKTATNRIPAPVDELQSQFARVISKYKKN